MKIDIITIFPEQIENFLSYSIPKIAQEQGKVKINLHNLRNWTTDKHASIDDRPFGGGAGMVIMIEPVFKAINELRVENSKVVVASPHGKTLNQTMLREMVVESDEREKHYIFLCGHYEGFDQRILDNLVDIQISLGDFVLSGGEIPTLAIIDGMIRLLPGVLGNDDSTLNESFENGLLEHPHYTRPANFNDWEVPEILLSGHHENIEKWRKERSIEITKKLRPDLIDF